ncbi:hypothetical protein EST38_g2921 [Candolleomyces aberdarensis]|uniref:cDENN domain-containing protein n=1 Tax=Candolleomyces aberdarensis TaxID=2316362 RepID=A0A4Q2DSD9_9AGAR|nr:hypothetical protein EST38_g2921 [Candolleomyces aberdarensis]
MASTMRRPGMPAPPVAATPVPADRVLKSRFSEQSLEIPKPTGKVWAAPTRLTSVSSSKSEPKKDRTFSSGTHDSLAAIVNISNSNPSASSITTNHQDPALADELDYITVVTPPSSSPNAPSHLRPDKASRILGIRHRRSMEPIPASTRNSIVSTRSLPLREVPPVSQHVPNLPPDVPLRRLGEGAVNRWWRPEVLGSTVSPGAGGGKKKKRGKTEEVTKGAGALSKQEVGKMLSKALKLSFTREVEVIASTLQPASTIHTFTFTLPAPSTPLAPTPSGDLLRASVLSNADHRSSAATFNYPYSDDPFARPSSAYLGPPSILGRGHNTPAAGPNASTPDLNTSSTPNITYYGVCLTVWSHADAERSNAIRRTLEAGRSRKESAQSTSRTSRLRSFRSDLSGSASEGGDPTLQARKQARKSARGPWGDAETDAETEADGAISESDFEVASTVGHGPGESTLFLPGDTVFWLPYALTLVSRHPVYDLMRDYLTLSWARFSKDVQSHTLQISKILAHPAPRAGELIKLDASPKTDGSDSNLEVIARFPGGLDFGRGLVDINFTMWPLFKCLNIDNILTICEIALAPTGKILFFSRYPAMLGIAVNTIKYLVELRGWSGIALPAVHSRDAKIYIDDPGPWIMGLSTEARYSVRPSQEVCVCDLDINYLSCPSPPPGIISTKQQREKYRTRLLSAFESHYHPDHCVPSEFKEAFPAGRFRPVCKIQAKRGASSAAVADQIKPPDWWHSTRIIQAFDSVLADKFKKPSFLKRITSFATPRKAPRLTIAEQHIQHSIRKRATAFVDARDELETKIGRLSRRLNFLMTESDLWRDKFSTFEQYAEKLSVEANQLRTKINKEQRETKRLSGLVTLTAAEKAKLQKELRETEGAHREATLELERMKETMERMELERSEMIAEVEAQIERALASMAVDIDDSDYGSSRPQSRLSTSSRFSSKSLPTRSRRPSDAVKNKHLRSFATDSTLAETYGEDDTITVPLEGGLGARTGLPEGTIEEEDEEVSATKKKRFSASEVEMAQDGMTAVDEGISFKSDKIAQKVFEIQQKLEDALATERRPTPKWKTNALSQESGDDSDRSAAVRPRPPRSKRAPPGKKRTRSGTNSSTQTSTPMTIAEERPAHHKTPSSIDIGIKTPTREAFTIEQSEIEPMPNYTEEMPEIPSELGDSKTDDLTPTAASTVIASPLPSPLPSMTDDSDTDFQSAYSASPRDKFVDLDEEDSSGIEDRLSHRSRTVSTATAIIKPARGLVPPM